MASGKVKRNILKTKQYNIFVSGLAYDAGKSGIADYTNNVVRELSKNHKVSILLLPEDVKIFPIKNANISFVIAPAYLRKAFKSMFWHLFFLPFRIMKSDYDCIFLPAGNRRLLSFYPKPTVVTFHDLSQFHINNKYDDFRMFYIKKVIPFFLKKAPIVMAISKNTIKDMNIHYKMNPAQIVLNYNGYDKNRFFSGQDPTDVRNEYGLKKDYFLYIARIEHPGKNHINLIKAYSSLPEDIKNKYDLVFAGSDWNGAEQVHSFAKQSNVTENIKFLGFVPDADIPKLYCGASLYVFPSFYEGFGIPLVEAMASLVPVVCSDTSSLPEIGGEAVVTFDPSDPTNIALTIQRVVSDNYLRSDMITKGLDEIKKYSWKKHAETIIDLFNNYEK